MLCVEKTDDQQPRSFSVRLSSCTIDIRMSLLQLQACCYAALRLLEDDDGKGMDLLYLAERLCTEIYERGFDELDTLESEIRNAERQQQCPPVQEGGEPCH